jgi:hypothetical protein
MTIAAQHSSAAYHASQDLPTDRCLQGQGGECGVDNMAGQHIVDSVQIVD